MPLFMSISVLFSATRVFLLSGGFCILGTVHFIRHGGAFSLKKQTSKDLLSFTLQELLICRSFEEITVGDLLEASGISRATFYKHFYGKEALLCFTADRMFDFDAAADDFFALAQRFLSTLDTQRRFMLRAVQVPAMQAHLAASLQSRLLALVACHVSDEETAAFVARSLCAVYLQAGTTYLHAPQAHSLPRLCACIRRAGEGMLSAFRASQCIAV